MEVDDYIQNVIGKGDEGSKLLNAICSETLKNSDLVEIIEEGMSGLAVLRIPDKYYAVVHSSSGEPKEKNLEKHSASMVERLVEQAEKINAQPIGFADVIDSSTGEESMLETVANALVAMSNKYGIAILNGENAILGARINPEIRANVSGTMISIIEKEKTPFLRDQESISTNGDNFAFFDPAGRAVYINSDGVGTKTEFYERAKKWNGALNDSLAMKLDDTIKIGAIAKVASDVVETKGNVPFGLLELYSKILAKITGITYILQREKVGGRLQGYKERVYSYNISGSVVSVIDEERLRNPLIPKVGDTLIAIRGDPNPRSNGITNLREIIVDMLGLEWHTTPEGKVFLDYLASPSTILYPIFRELIDNGLATSVYHMSGGAFNGKLARPLAKNNLLAKIDDLFEPSKQQINIINYTDTANEISYAKWPMGNDGFITVTPENAKEAIEIINAHGLEAKTAGRIEGATDGIRTGVLLRKVSNSDGNPVHYSGKDKT